jgi:predicted MFS family arabinose efflux permease
MESSINAAQNTGESERAALWPALPFEAWRDTCQTLHLWTPLAPPDKRAELIASIYVVAYLAFSIPSFIAGVAVTHYSLRETTYAYGLVVMALSAITAVALWRRRASPRAAVGARR